MNKTLAVALVALALAVVAFAFPRTAERVVETVTLGASSGTEHSQTETFQSGLVAGGSLVISTTTSVVLKASEMDKASVIAFPTTASPVINVTLPASTTFPLLKVGDSRIWVIDNQHTAAATTTTIVAGTGVDIDGTTANDDVINGGVSGVLRCWRLANTDVRCIVEEMVDAG